MRHIEKFLEVVRTDVIDGCAILGFSPNMPRYMADVVVQAQQEDIVRLAVVARYHGGEVLAAYDNAIVARRSEVRRSRKYVQPTSQRSTTWEGGLLTKRL